MITKVNETRSDEYKNLSLIGFVFSCLLSHGTVNTDIAANDFLPENVIIKAILRGRGGRDRTIFQDNLKNLGTESELYNGAYHSAFALSYVEILAKGAAVKEQHLAGISVRHLPITLKGNESLYFECQVSPGTFSANLDTAVSYVDFQPILTDDIETYTPSIISYSIQSGETRFRKSFGDNVQSVTILNHDKTDNLEASAPVKSYSLNAKDYYKTENYYQMVASRHKMLGNITDSNLRYNNFNVYHGVELDGVDMEIQLTAANVNAGKNFVIVRQFDIEQSVMSRASSLMQNKTNVSLKKVTK